MSVGAHIIYYNIMKTSYISRYLSFGQVMYAIEYFVKTKKILNAPSKCTISHFLIFHVWLKTTWIKTNIGSTNREVLIFIDSTYRLDVF